MSNSVVYCLLINYITVFCIFFNGMGGKLEYEDAEPVEDLDNGMGNTVGMLRSDLLDSIDELATELGVELPGDSDSYSFSYSDEHSKVIVKAESYGGVKLPIAEATAFLEDTSYHEPMSHQNSNDSEIRLGNDGLDIREENLRASGSYFRDNAS